MTAMANKPPGKLKKGLKRNTIDKFYTKENVVELCQALLQQYVIIEPTDLIIEPSAGDGSFLPMIKTFTSQYRFYDIEPEHREILKQDYLHLDMKPLVDLYQKIHVIGNPPFGRQSAHARKFIKKSCAFCQTLAFILPKSYKKESFQKSFPPNFHLLHTADLPENAFLIEGVEHNVPCVFQIWEKRPQKRIKPTKLEPTKFYFVNQAEKPDLSFRRVGVNAGAIATTELEKKSPQSHYFIKFINTDLNLEFLTKLATIHFTHDNTVGPRSISKQELIKEFNMVL